MAKVLGREADAAEYREETEFLYRQINEKMWDEETAFYYDLRRDGSKSGVKSVASYWTLLAGLVASERAERFIAHLDNEAEFKRHNRIPSLSADHDGYKADGGYWQGGVWAPTNYMTMCGLHKYGYNRLAHEIACDYLRTVVNVYNESGTLYENYAPESDSIGNPAKPDFVGWTGLAPISIMFEYVFGIHPNAQQKKLTWHINLTEKHGIRQYPLGDATVDLICHERASYDAAPSIALRSDKPITLEIEWNGNRKVYKNVTEIGQLD